MKTPIIALLACLSLCGQQAMIFKHKASGSVTPYTVTNTCALRQSTTPTFPYTWTVSSCAGTGTRDHIAGKPVVAAVMFRSVTCATITNSGANPLTLSSVASVTDSVNWTAINPAGYGNGNNGCIFAFWMTPTADHVADNLSITQTGSSSNRAVVMTQLSGLTNPSIDVYDKGNEGSGTSQVSQVFSTATSHELMLMFATVSTPRPPFVVGVINDSPSATPFNTIDTNATDDSSTSVMEWVELTALRTGKTASIAITGTTLTAITVYPISFRSN